MKKKVLATIVALGCALSVQAQNILIANNNPGAPTGTQVYPNLQDAIDAAGLNDIIHVIPSSTSYGDVVISASYLTLQGIGINPDKAVGTKSTTGKITIQNGVNNIKIDGIEVSNNYIQLGHTSTGNITNIIVENCIAGHVSQYSSSVTIGNVIIRNNVLIGTASGDPNIDFTDNTSGVIATNNIIMGYYSRGIGGNGIVVENNIFFGDGSADSFGTLHNSTIRKNVFYGSSFQLSELTSATGNAFEDNIAYTAATGDTAFLEGINGNTSLNDRVFTDLSQPFFENLTMTNTWQDELDFTLAAGSPLIVVAADPTQNVGPSGGSTPFNSEGTSLPLIERVTAPSVIQQGENLDVRIQASGN
jgi:hypothetical protein